MALPRGVSVLPNVRKLQRRLSRRLIPRSVAAWRSEREARPRTPQEAGWSFTDVQRRFPDPRDRYRYFLWFYRNCLPGPLRAHREYFAEAQRGFGEDAFHAMWIKLFEEFRPTRCLEIGVYRGQALSYFTLLARTLGLHGEAWGVSPLDTSGDAVSFYAVLDYKRDIELNFEKFGLENPKLLAARSQDPLAQAFVKGSRWDLIYLDGSHEEGDVRSDVSLAREALAPGGLLVMDDAALGTGYRPFSFSFAGHPGPSRVASSPRDMRGFVEIGDCGHNRVFKRIPSLEAGEVANRSAS